LAELTSAKAVEIELGMGNGLAMLERARVNPERLFVGVEVYLNGLRSLVSRLEQAPSVKNVRLAPMDARELLPELPKACVDRLLVPYPDPWPKARHHKRRLVQGGFLSACARVLKPAGELWLVTDIEAYANWVEEKMAAQRAFILQKNTQPPGWWVATKYEKKAIKEGRVPQYLVMTLRPFSGESEA
jgi:tRNA (guanine-N7-)-methyltransferase